MQKNEKNPSSFVDRSHHLGGDLMVKERENSKKGTLLQAVDHLEVEFPEKLALVEFLQAELSEKNVRIEEHPSRSRSLIPMSPVSMMSLLFSKKLLPFRI